MARWSFAVSVIALSIFFLSNQATAQLSYDLEASNLTITDERVIQDKEANGYFLITNHANETISGIDAKFTISDSGSSCECNDECETPISFVGISIDAGETLQKNFSFTPRENTGEKLLTILIDCDGDVAETNETNNKDELEVYIYDSEKHDLIIEDFEVDPVDLLEGDQATINITIKDEGDLYAELSFTVIVRDLTDDSIDPTSYSVQITENDELFVVLSINWTPETPGEHNISVEVDSDDDVDEYDEDDNNNGYFYVSVGDRLPELGINNGTHSFEQEDDWLVDIFEFHNNTLSFDVNNFDHHEEVDNATIHVYLTKEGDDEILLHNFTGIRVPSGTLEENSTQAIPGNTNLNLVWNPDSFGNYTFRLIVDPDNDIEEYNETNNEISFDVIVFEALADLVVTGISSVDEEPRAGIEGDVRLNVTNLGAATSNGFTLQFLVDGRAEVIYSWDIVLEEGDSSYYITSFVWERTPTQAKGKIVMDEGVNDHNITNNLYKEWINVLPARYDISIVDIDHPTEVFEGEVLELSVVLTNKLSRICCDDQGDVKVALYLDGSNHPCESDGCVVYLYDLDNQETASVILWWDDTQNFHGGELPRNHTFRVEITVRSHDDEEFSDNEYEFVATLKAREYQVTIDQWIIIPDQLYINQTIDIDVYVLNVGFEDLPDGVQLVFFIDGVLIDSQISGELQRVTGESKLSFTWTPVIPGTYELKFQVDPNDIIDEWDEDDNILYKFVNVTNQQFVEIENEGEDEESLFSLINIDPWLIVPAILVVVLGLVLVVAIRNSQGSDDFTTITKETNTPIDRSAEQGLEYDPETGELVIPDSDDDDDF